MNDHIADEDLAAYVNGALPGAPKAELESHLSRCPECLAALAEIVEIQGSAVKIPAEFLGRALEAVSPRSDAVPGEGPEGSRRGRALGERPSPARVAAPTRLVFGIAAVFLVAVLIGFYLLDRGRRETAGIVEKEMTRPAVPAEEHRPPAADAGAGKARKSQVEAVNGWQMKKKLVAGKTAAPAALPGKAERLRMADEKDLALPRGVEGGTVGGVVGGVVDGVEAQPDRDREGTTKLAAAAAAPAARAQELDKSGSEILSEAVVSGRSKGAAPEAGMPPRSRLPGASASADAMQLFLAVTGRAASPPAVEIGDSAQRPAIRIAGDVSRADLSDPALLDSWTWFPAGLVMRLDIDPAGKVAAVVTLGPWDATAAALAQAAARELRFPASGRKSRRAVLTASAAPN